MAGPTITRGEIYGGEEGTKSASADASGAVKTGPSPAMFWLGALMVLVLIRLVWERAD